MMPSLRFQVPRLTLSSPACVKWKAPNTMGPLAAEG